MLFVLIFVTSENFKKTFKIKSIINNSESVYDFQLKWNFQIIYVRIEDSSYVCFFEKN